MSGIPNICMRVRRFRKYFPECTTMFKTDSLCMLTSHSVNLVGFSLCGLYESKSVEAYQKMDSKAVKSIKSENQEKFMKINLKILELDNLEKYDVDLTPISSINIDLPVISNITDPVFQFYLDSAVSLNKDKFYIIIISNLSDNLYVDIWKGRVSDDSELTQNSVICNNSCVKFNFLNAYGLESDINEFTSGLLSDVIFSHID